MGQRRVEETLVGQAEAARLLGVAPDELPKLLRKHGAKPQKVQVAEREAVVYGLSDEVEDRTDAPVRDLLVGTSTIAEILGKPLPNVVKMLDRRGLQKQIVAVGRRQIAVYLREDVERVRRVEERRLAAKA